MAEASGADGGTALERAWERAQAALAAGRRDDAIAALGQAALLAPRPAPLWHDRGYLELAAGRIADAALSFRAATAADATFALAHLRLGVALQALDDTPGAIAAFRRAVALAPARSDAPYRLGALLASLGHDEEAAAAFRVAAAAAPASPMARLACARLARDRHDDEGAERILRGLLAAHPGHLEATELLATTLAETGQRAEAWDRFADVVRRSPQYAGSFYDMSLCRPTRPEDAVLVAELEALASRGGTHREALIRLHLGLGRAADDLGEPQRAMRHFAAASRLRDPSVAASAGRLVAHAARAAELFDAERMARVPASDRADAPILILGLPRSGTTLVEHILSSHGQVRAGGELAFWNLRAPLVPEAWPGDEEVAALAASYRETLLEVAGSGRRATDKAPLNVLHAGLIHLAVPDVRIVLCRRRPIDVALSIHRTWFNHLAGFPTGGEALVAVIRAVEALADHWRAVLPPTRFHELRHEELVASPATEIRALLAFCGLEFEAACLTPETNRRPVRTPSKWQVRRTITVPDPEGWRRYAGGLGPLEALAPPARRPGV